jgi:hypothetical protein
LHYDGPGNKIGPTESECWNHENPTKLAKLKSGLVARERHIVHRMTKRATPYCQPLVVLVNRLRKVAFPRGGPLEKEDKELGSPGSTERPKGLRQSWKVKWFKELLAVTNRVI